MKNILLASLIVLLGLAFGWLTTCGLVWLITLCFGLPFTWGIGTGVFLVIFTINWAFQFKVKISKE